MPASRDRGPGNVDRGHDDDVDQRRHGHDRQRGRALRGDQPAAGANADTAARTAHGEPLGDVTPGPALNDRVHRGVLQSEPLSYGGQLHPFAKQRAHRLDVISSHRRLRVTFTGPVAFSRPASRVVRRRRTRARVARPTVWQTFSFLSAVVVVPVDRPAFTVQFRRPPSRGRTHCRTYGRVTKL